MALAICLLAGQSTIALLPEVAAAEWTEDSRPCDVAPWAILPQSILSWEVGEPVVPTTGYFTYGETPEEGPPASDFTATADWGDGTTVTATVEAGSVGDCYAVSVPTHAYTSVGTYPFSYTVHDIKTGLDHTLGATELHIWSEIPSLLGGPSTTRSNVEVKGVAVPDLKPPIPVRLRGQPILAAIPRASRAPVYELIFRTNQPLPQTSSEHVEALIEAHGQTNPVSDLIAHGTSTCYMARTHVIGKRELKRRARYPFTLAIDAGSVTRDSGDALVRHFVNLNRTRSIAGRALGCA